MSKKQKSKIPNMFDMIKEENRYKLVINGEFTAYCVGTLGLPLSFVQKYISDNILCDKETYERIWFNTWERLYPKEYQEAIDKLIERST